jgi:hypothetical protein
MLGNYRVAAQLVASRAVLSYTELVNVSVCITLLQNRKVAGSITDVVNPFSNLPNTSSCSVYLWRTQSLTDINVRNLPSDNGQAGG